MGPWFKPLAYALILLRQHGVPSVFYPTFTGKYRDSGDDGDHHEVEIPVIESLPKLIEARSRFAHGAQTDYFDHPSCLAFARHGTPELPRCVVILSNGEAGSKEIELGPDFAGAEFRDFLGHQPDSVTADDQGKAAFSVQGGSVRVWVRSN